MGTKQVRVFYSCLDGVIDILQASSGNTLALQVDSEGNVRYDAIALQGQREGKTIQSQFKDLVPLAHRKDLEDGQKTMERPSEEEVQATAEKTRVALEKLVTGKIKAAQPKNVPDSQGKTSFIRYTPRAAGRRQRAEAADNQDVGGGGRSPGAPSLQTQKNPARASQPASTCPS